MSRNHAADGLLEELSGITPPGLYCPNRRPGEDTAEFAARLDAAADITESLLADLAADLIGELSGRRHVSVATQPVHPDRERAA